MSRPLTFLCIATFFKGTDFLKACKAQGNTVLLLTKHGIKDKDWPKESVDEFYYLEKDENSPENLDIMAKGIAHVLKTRKIDRIVALDDFDVEKGAYLREKFRIPGMGATTSQYFRDKLAMRMKAKAHGILVPPFSALFNNDQINAFADNTPTPWVVKPRSEASAVGIKKVHSKEELWQVINELGDTRANYLVEQFKPGDVYHADSINVDGKTPFCRVSKYVNTPFEVAHGGGVFRTATVEFGGEEDQALQAMNERIMRAFGLRYSASHTEFIRANEDGQFYFLETSCRVGGAHIAEMVEVSSGINLWAEWAKVEDAVAKGLPYQLPEVKYNPTGLLVSLSRFEYPDTSQLQDPEIVWRINKPYHVGFILTSESQQRVLDLLDQYTQKVYDYYHASLPIQDKLSD